MKRTAIILIALALSMSWGAKAQQLDLSTMTCDSFIKSDKDQMEADYRVVVRLLYE